MDTLEDVTTSQLADAIRQASEEVSWVPGDRPRGAEYYRQVALRTQGHLRRCGVIDRVDKETRDRISAALDRIKQAGTT